jgi:hypothetical protein
MMEELDPDHVEEARPAVLKVVDEERWGWMHGSCMRHQDILCALWRLWTIGRLPVTYFRQVLSYPGSRPGGWGKGFEDCCTLVEAPTVNELVDDRAADYSTTECCIGG